MKIFTSAQIHELDKSTIEHETGQVDRPDGARSKGFDAAIHPPMATDGACHHVCRTRGTPAATALAVSRMLTEQGYPAHTFLFNINGHLSADWAENQRRLLDNKRAKPRS